MLDPRRVPVVPPIRCHSLPSLPLGNHRFAARDVHGGTMTMAAEEAPRLVAAFPKSETELRLVFSEPMDSRRVEDPNAFECRTGLPIHSGWVDPQDPARVTLRTDPMN